MGVKNLVGLDVTKLKLPIQKFEVNLDDKFSDDRFEKVKIWIAHTGENLNHTSFSSQAFEKMSKTLPYTPIVGYIKKVDDKEDFDGHNQRITIEDDNMKIEYLPQPYGFIPEDSNAKIEYRDGKEWLTAEGYMWNKFPQGVEIIKNSMGSKPQSMEIDNVSGSVSDEGILNIDDARFSALCILGDDVAPAMTGSTIEMFSLKDSGKTFKDSMREMFEEYSKKGENTLEDNKEIVEETSNLESEDTSKDSANEDKEVEQKETTTDDVKTEEDKDVSETEEVVDENEVIDENGVVDESIETQEVGRDVNQDTATDADIDNNNFSESVLSLQSKIEELERENKELKEFKANVERKDKENVLATYSKRLDKDDIKNIESKINEFSIDELEREIAFCIIKKEKQESEDKTASISSYNLNKTKSNGRYGSLDAYFQ